MGLGSVVPIRYLPGPVLEARQESRGSLRVLVADPDDRALVQLRGAVLAAGYSVETVSTAKQLLDAARRSPTHLIALGLDLPDLTTASTIERLHAMCAVPPIVLLARHGHDPRRGPLGQSVAACLFKPVDAGRFVGICERVLRLADQRHHEGDWRVEPRRSFHAEVTVDAGGRRTLTATLVDLSPRGFRIELPEPVGVGRAVRVSVRIPESPNGLAFDGRILWEKKLSRWTLAGGDLVSVGPEEARILAALI
jgi:DNA-binding response OmpR family regulator